MPGPRIVSLIASATEIVAALGLLENLVGVSHECDHPAGVEHLPPCSRPKIDFKTSSYRVDQQIQSLLRDGLSIYEVDAELLRSLKPDVIVTQTHCEVCAVSEKDVESALGAWIESGPKLVSLHPDQLADVWSGIEEIAAACGVPERGGKLVTELKAQMAAVSLACRADPRRPRVGCIEWCEPLMVAGNWMPELIAMANGADPLGQPGRHSPLCSWERLAEADPDLLLVMPCGYGLERTAEELPLLWSRPEWQKLRAVRTGEVYLGDGNAFFNRPGPRLAETFEILAEILHPAYVEGRHKGTGWRRAD